MLLPFDERVYAFTRRLAEVELLVVANLSGEVVTAEVPDAAAWAGSEIVLANYPPQTEERALVLRPWEARVYRCVTPTTD